MSFTIGDGVIDYNDDGTDFAITFSQNNEEVKNKDIKEKVNEFNETANILNKIQLSVNVDENVVNVDENVVNVDENVVNVDENVVNVDENVVNKKVLFSVFQSENQEIDGRTKILFNQKEYDTHNYFCSNTSKFHPKVSGFYQINCGVNCFSQNGKTLLIELLKNGKVFKRGEQTNLLNEIITYKTTSLSSLIYLNGEDDYIEINVICSPKFLTYPGEEFTWMNGFLIN